MLPIYDPMELDITTAKEREFFDLYVTSLLEFEKGKLDGIKLKALTAGASVIAKRQQSRSAMAMIKYDREKRGIISTSKRIGVGKRA